MKKVYLIPFALSCLFHLGGLAQANIIENPSLLNDPQSAYSCGLSIKDSKGKLLSYAIFRNPFNTASASSDPPGNATELLIQESSQAGIVASFEMYEPSKPWWNPFAIEHEQATFRLYRRTGQVETDASPDGGAAIVQIEKDTKLGEIGTIGTTQSSAQMDQYLVELSCIENAATK